MLATRARAMQLAAGLLLAASCASVAAHDFHMGIADISFNARTGSTEIVHTYTAHDVEALLANLYQRNLDLGAPESEAPLRRYLERQFYLTAPDGKRLPLRWVGYKADADSVQIFEEIEHTRVTPGTRIHNGVLIDFLPAQRNTVNLQTGAAIQTLLFDDSSVEQATP